MSATIKDIARKLNLSVSTVSYALNDGPKPVSIAVRESVHQAAKELGYRKNRIARSLVTGTNRTIGVVLPELLANTFLSSFVQLTINGIVNAAEDSHMDILLLTAVDRTRPEGLTDDLLDSRVDGVIFLAPPTNAEVLDHLKASGMPFAIVAGGNGTFGPEFTADNAGGARQLMDHLYELGHRRIAHVTGRLSSDDGQIRRQVYVDFVKERGLPWEEAYLFPGDYLTTTGRHAAKVLMKLKTPPTAVFCGNDEMARGFIEEVRAMGMEVPRDVSVAGFDDGELSSMFIPPLTTVRQPVQEMAVAAFQAVLSMVGQDGHPKGACFPTSLVVRASTASPRQ